MPPSGPDIQIDTADGSSFQIDLSSDSTIGDVQNTIQTATGGKVSVKINPQGGLSLVDNTTGSGNFSIANVNGTSTATNLGIVGSTAGGGTILGSNVTQANVQGVFNTLIQLRNALTNGNQSGIQSAGSQLTNDLNRLSVAQGTVGAQISSLNTLSSNLTTNITSLTSQNSNIVNVDLATVTTQLSTQQTAMQAALQAGSMLFQKSLMDYL